MSFGPSCYSCRRLGAHCLESEYEWCLSLLSTYLPSLNEGLLCARHCAELWENQRLRSTQSTSPGTDGVVGKQAIIVNVTIREVRSDASNQPWYPFAPHKPRGWDYLPTHLPLLLLFFDEAEAVPCWTRSLTQMFYRHHHNATEAWEWTSLLYGPPRSSSQRGLFRWQSQLISASILLSLGFFSMTEKGSLVTS